MSTPGSGTSFLIACINMVAAAPPHATPIMRDRGKRYRSNCGDGNIIQPNQREHAGNGDTAFSSSIHHPESAHVIRSNDRGGRVLQGEELLRGQVAAAQGVMSLHDQSGVALHTMCVQTLLECMQALLCGRGVLRPANQADSLVPKFDQMGDCGTDPWMSAPT